MTTPSPFVGAHACLVREVRPLAIHGTRYWAYRLELESDARRVLEARVPHEASYEDPQVGDPVFAHMVLGQVTRVSLRQPGQTEPGD